MSLPSKDVQAAIAATRFGLGAKPGEIDTAKSDPRGWLKAQVKAGPEQPQSNGTPLDSARVRIAGFGDFQRARQNARVEGDAAQTALQQARIMLRDDVGEEFLARAQLGALTNASFTERWTLFWANHFTVSATKQITGVVTGPFEREAIRPHVYGRFEDLLLASTRHPAMLSYLDQEQSFGKNSQIAQRRKNVGLNENLAREIMELHTLGVDGGYKQADVTEFARALTGWSFVGPNENDRPGPFAEHGDPGSFVFRAAAHDPGDVVIMGKHYAQEGELQAHAVLADLAKSPATARHIATKLGRHFVADTPPPALTDKLTKAFLANDGRLDKVAETLIDCDEAWAETPAKFKTPYEFVISSYRAVGAAPNAIGRIAPILNTLGQRAFYAPSPKGWPEEAQAWAAPDGIIKRLSYAEQFAAQTVNATPALDPKDLAQSSLGARLTPAVATAVARAESRPEAVAILMMSPEFQRR